MLKRYAEVVVGPELRRSLYLLLAVVAVVLVIACVNVANIVLGWALAREHEIAVRVALGASTARIARQFVTESVLVATAGGLVWIGIGYAAMVSLKAAVAALPLNIALFPILMPPEASIQLDWRVLAFSVLLTIACGIACGLVPAIAARRRVSRAIISTGQHATGSVAHGRLRDALVIAQVALAFALLSNAGLLVRTFVTMRQADTGFNGTNVLTAEIATPQHRFADADQLRAFMRDVRARVRALPGVVDAAFVDAFPMQGTPLGAFVQNARHPHLERAQRPVARLKVVGPGYFDVLQLRVRRGRALNDRDRENAPLVAVVNETMARSFFPGEDPIGGTLLMDAPGFGLNATAADARYRVVGVIADERLYPFDDREPHPAMYVSNEQDPRTFNGTIVRTSLDPDQLGPVLRSAITAIDKQDAVTTIKSVEELKSETMIPDRWRTATLSVFAAVALVLTAIGIFGVMSYSVVKRRPEIGIRAALGASPANLIHLVVQSGMRLTAAGLVIGSVVGYAIGQLIKSFFYGVGPLDFTAWVTAVMVLTTVALSACYLPARATTLVDPVDALRSE